MNGNLAQVREAIEGDGIVGLDFRTPRSWIALIAVAGREQKAADRLRENHVRAYWPNYCVSEAVGRQANGRSFCAPRLRALIPGYIFIAVRRDGEINLSAVVEETPGIRGYMRNGMGEPAALTERDITKIRELEADQNKAPVKSHVHNFKTGQKVRFKLIPEWRGPIAAFCDDGRISVAVAMLGRIVPTKALPHQIEAM